MYKSAPPDHSNTLLRSSLRNCQDPLNSESRSPSAVGLRSESELRVRVSRSESELRVRVSRSESELRVRVSPSEPELGLRVSMWVSASE